MTGPIGARTNHRVALVTDDFRLYHELVPLFSAQGHHLLGLAPQEPVPAAVEALIGGPPDDARSTPLLPDAQATFLAARSVLDGHTDGYGTVVFGLDPGEAIGLAVVGDGEALLVDQVFDPEAAIARVAAWRTGLTAAAWRVHIGDGAPAVGIRLEGIAHKRLDGVSVRFVPEDDTSPTSVETRSRHTDAAIHIAQRLP